MKEKFLKAEMEIIEFETEDVITASNELPGVNPFSIDIDIGNIDSVEP